MEYIFSKLKSAMLRLYIACGSPESNSQQAFFFLNEILKIIRHNLISLITQASKFSPAKLTQNFIFQNIILNT